MWRRDRRQRGQSSGSGSDSTNRNCGAPPKTIIIPDQPYECAPIDAGSADGDVDVDVDAGDAGPCTPMRRNCDVICGSADPTNTYPGYESCNRVTGPGGETGIACVTYGRPCGRRHEGLAPPRSAGVPSIGGYLAESAYVEHASVASFAILAAELRAHGGPARLVRGAERSANDERRHTRMMTSLAKRHGSTPELAVTPPRALRPLAAMLRENAVEGCVGETYGALLAWYQSAHAADPHVRAAMTRIAEDETRHAALAWQIAAWAEADLDEATRHALAVARARALEELEAALAVEPAPEVATALGLPSASTAQTMLEQLRAAVTA